MAVIYDMEMSGHRKPRMPPGTRNAKLRRPSSVLRRCALKGLNVDVLDEDASLDGYKLVSAPMLYMLKEGFCRIRYGLLCRTAVFLFRRITRVLRTKMTSASGTVPNGLTDVFGIGRTEIDALNDWEEK